MNTRSTLWSALVLVATIAAGGVALLSGTSRPALAQPNPQPPECKCSAGVSIGAEGKQVLIRHCQCGILSCAVVVPSGELQCAR